MNEKLLTLRELADVTGESYWFWWKLTKKGDVPCIKIGRKILFRLSTIEAWLDEQEKASIRPVKDNQLGVLRQIR